MLKVQKLSIGVEVCINARTLTEKKMQLSTGLRFCSEADHIEILIIILNIVLFN